MLNRTFSLTAAVCAAAMLPLAASAAETAPVADASAAGAAQAAQAAPATDDRLPVTEAAQDTLVVVRDAETGKLRAATNEERAALQSLRATKRAFALSAVAATPQAKRHAVSGATGVRLTDDMFSHSVVVRRPDGKLEELCFPSKQEADAAVAKGFVAKAELPTK
ncbi:post-PEP-CTERM-1 domain-containing protein [Roseateles depolymerans]|uniref:Uncharacterized protein n=1 Tax=Roseateles depolymerans TaxID=76731 RepID=A0A0U3LFT5_9BURK|nr:hypothetical protein [Roseateles depolymerans]ALV05330.1 hypothetical protein RD2015_834 [Roseateles depolymerans]REG14654.1 hypothetical protein DES44_3150 [Roseateles depolymerans]